MGWNDVKNAGNSEKTNYTRFPEGTTMIRILDEEPFSYWQHWIPSAKTSITCPGKGCPICNVIAKQRANKEKPLYNSSKRHAMRIWNYTTNQMEIMIQGMGFMSNILALHEEVGDVRTYDIKVKRNGTDTQTTYTCLPTAPSEFEFINEVKDLNLEEVLSAPTNDEIIQLMEGKTWAEINGLNEDVA